VRSGSPRLGGFDSWAALFKESPGHHWILRGPASLFTTQFVTEVLAKRARRFGLSRNNRTPSECMPGTRRLSFPFDVERHLRVCTSSSAATHQTLLNSLSA
jgi:hypothetical protein